MHSRLRDVHVSLLHISARPGNWRHEQRPCTTLPPAGRPPPPPMHHIPALHVPSQAASTGPQTRAPHVEGAFEGTTPGFRTHQLAHVPLLCSGEALAGQPAPRSTCLVRSDSPNDSRKGLALLVEPIQQDVSSDGATGLAASKHVLRHRQQSGAKAEGCLRGSGPSTSSEKVAGCTRVVRLKWLPMPTAPGAPHCCHESCHAC